MNPYESVLHPVSGQESLPAVRSTAAARARSGMPGSVQPAARAIPAALFQPAPPRARRAPRRTLRHKLLGWLNAIIP
jgi:hypothetical protein